ncbi:MAG: ABC transporter ATP-binding protein [Nocardioidaceae bacterium]
MPSTRCLPVGKRPTIAARDPRTGGAHVAVEALGWQPLGRRTPVLHDLDLTIPAGQRVLLAGPSGAGKSTLLRALAGLLLTAGHGEVAGSVRIDGHDVHRRLGGTGLLLQDPLAGVVAETVGRDVAFGLENARVPRSEIWPRVHATLSAAQFPYPATHLTRALSGGETQRLVLAGNLVLDNGLLLLDEPTSMLDAEAANAVRGAIQREVRERGCTMVAVEHHLEPWVDFADRLLVIGRHGEVLADGVPAQILAEQGDALSAQGVWLPGLPAPRPVPVDATLVAPWVDGPQRLVTATGVRVELRSSLADRAAPPTVALAGVDVELRSGQALAVTGVSGAGKSTLVSVLAGLLRPTAGSVEADPALATRRGTRPWRWRSRDLTARLAWAPQSPEHGIVTATVRDEVLASARACGRDTARAEARAVGLLEVFGLDGLATVSPYHLSGGEQRRLIVAATLAHGPYGVLLDEPTVGQDRHTWGAVIGAISAARDAGAGVAVSTHDLMAADVLADDRTELAGGRVVR